MIQLATRDDEERLRALLQLYVYDLSELFALDPGEDGRYRTPSLDGYFDDPRKHAYLLRVDEHLAGFALVQRGSRLTGDPEVSDLAEFFVARRHRRRGVGARAAAELFDCFPGRWEVRQRAENTAATAFWRRAIGAYTGGRFDEEQVDSERWRGPVQRFDKPG
jgi:predicted acetyltransferase